MCGLIARSYVPRATVRHDDRVRLGVFVARRSACAMFTVAHARRHPALAVAWLVDGLDRRLKPRHVPLAVVEEVVAAVASRSPACQARVGLRPATNRLAIRSS